MIPSFITIIVRKNQWNDNELSSVNNNNNSHNKELLFDKDMDQNIANVMEDVITNHVTLIVSDEEEDDDDEYSEEEDDEYEDYNMMEVTPTSTPPEHEESSRMVMTDADISFHGSNVVGEIYYDSNSNSNSNSNYDNKNTNNTDISSCEYEALFEGYDVMFPYSDTALTPIIILD